MKTQTLRSRFSRKVTYENQNQIIRTQISTLQIKSRIYRNSTLQIRWVLRKLKSNLEHRNQVAVSVYLDVFEEIQKTQNLSSRLNHKISYMKSHRRKSKLSVLLPSLGLGNKSLSSLLCHHQALKKRRKR